MKPVPVIVTGVPTTPDDRMKPVIVGAGTTVKLTLLVVLPARLVTVTGPLVAPGGTAVVMCASESTV